MPTTGSAFDGSLPEGGLPERLPALRRKLGRKAKQEPHFRFYSLYDKVCRTETLAAAWRQVRENDGAPGLDGLSVGDIERSEQGVAGFLDELQASLVTGSYRPHPVRRVYIAKENGKLRPLGIPCIRDRVAQTAVKLIIEPIFEADFLDCSHGFRPGRDAHKAMNQVQANLKGKRQAVYDADLASYFDTIPHGPLMDQVKRRITDSRVLRLIRMWLQCSVVEDDETGQPRMTTPKSGTPQGGVISPLLANIYLHQMDRAFYEDIDGPYRVADARLVRYADDFVILARFIGPRIVAWIESTLEGKLGLTVNREKTRIVRMSSQGDTFDFLGFTLRINWDLFGNRTTYLRIVPASKAIKHVQDSIRDKTRSGYKRPLKVVVKEVDEILRGWGTYFRYGYPKAAFHHVNHFVHCRFRRFVRNRSQRRCKPFRKGEKLYVGLQRYGLHFLKA